MSRGQSTPAKPAEVIADWLADAAAPHAADKSLVRRKSLRHAWPAPLDVIISPRTVWEQCISATGINVSEGGMGLLVGHALPIGTTLLLRYAGEDDESRWVRAEVMYSKRSIDGYQVGARFELPRVT